MQNRLFHMIIVIFYLTGTLGCANIENDRKRTQTESTMAGAGAGAVLGGLIGYAVKGGDGALAGAIIGAGAGGISGYAYGTHIADEKEKYAREEEWLDACVLSAKNTIKDTREYNQELAKNMVLLDMRSKELVEQYNNKQIRKKDLLIEKEIVETKLAEAEEKLKTSRFELMNQNKVLADARKNNKDHYVDTLDSEIARLEKQIAELEGHTRSLASISQRMTV